MRERILGLPRNIFFLGLTSLFNDFSSEMVYAAFPAFFVSVLKAGAGSLGLVDGIAEAASNFFKIYSGNLSDRFQRRKPFVVFGYTLSVLTRPLYLLVSTVPGALGLRFLDRVGKGFRDAPRDAIISLSIPKAELGKSFGYHRAMDTLGAILGPLAAFFILEYLSLDFNAVFMTAFFVGLISVATLFFIADVAGTEATHRASFREGFRALPLRFKYYLLSMFILSAGSLPVAVVLLKTESIGLVIASIPLFYMIYNLSYALFSYSAGRMSDTVGPKNIILAGYAFLLVAYAVIAFADSTVALVAGFLIFGLFPALTDGVQRAFASDLSPVAARGGGLGWLNAVNGFGALVAGIGGGWLWQAYSPAAAFAAAAFVICCGLVFFFFTVTPSAASR